MCHELNPFSMLMSCFLCTFQLAPIRLSKYHDDLLFYIYYSNGGDLMQTLAAAELYVCMYIT